MKIVPSSYVRQSRRAKFPILTSLKRHQNRKSQLLSKMTFSKNRQIFGEIIWGLNFGKTHHLSGYSMGNHSLHSLFTSGRSPGFKNLNCSSGELSKGGETWLWWMLIGVPGLFMIIFLFFRRWRRFLEAPEAIGPRRSCKDHFQSVMFLTRRYFDNLTLEIVTRTLF